MRCDHRALLSNGLMILRTFFQALLLVFVAGLDLIGSVAGAETLIVLNSGDATLSIIDRETRKSVGLVNTGKEPHHLMATPDDRSLIIASSASNELLFVDPRSGAVQRRIRDIADPYQIGYSPDGKWFVANAFRLNHVDIYSAADFTLAKRIPLGKLPSHLAFDRSSRFVFVTLQDSRKLAAIDLATQAVAWELEVGDTPAGVWMTPDDRHLLVGVMGAGDVAVVDWRTRQIVKRIVTDRGAHNFQALGDGRHVFVSNRSANTVSLIDQQTLAVVKTFKTPSGPDCMEVSADRKELWLTARWARKVAVFDIDSGKLKFTIPVGRSPHGLFFLSHAPRV